jgi:polysaccharide biosynthesis transport protein
MNQRVSGRLGVRRSANGSAVDTAPAAPNGVDARGEAAYSGPGGIWHGSSGNGALKLDAFDSAHPRPSSAAAEAFRTLALTVDLLLAESSLRSLVVLSAMPGDGRSLVADLLARGLSEIRPPVRLLDADPFGGPKASTNGRSTNGHSAKGVTLDLNDASLVGFDFARLPLAGDVFANHRDFLSAVRSLLAVETAAGATVVIDVPACSTSSVPFVVAEMADAAIYVARTGTEASASHAEMRAQLDLLGVQLLGVVFNEK